MPVAILPRHDAFARSWKIAAAIVLGLATIPGAPVGIETPAVAGADVCASVGRRVSVGGCANLADTIADYVPPPAYYAPMPDDEPAPEYAAPPRHRPRPTSTCARMWVDESPSAAAFRRDALPAKLFRIRDIDTAPTSSFPRPESALLGQ